MNAEFKYRSMNRSTLRLIVAALAGLMLLGSVGCDESKLSGTNGEQSDNANEERGDENADPTGEVPLDEDPGHGSGDEEGVVIPAGFMNGSWRASAGEQDEPAVYFDTFQDEGDPEISGDFTMGFAIYELYDGETGHLETASFDGETLTVMWNPTTDRDEMLTLKATRVDENTLEGSVTAKRNIELNVPVTLTRVTE
ncbi:hypothetical protein [Bradymonas sediminis]|nr:hypothetical protein [Bradymonas sediminis]